MAKDFTTSTRYVNAQRKRETSLEFRKYFYHSA